MRGIGVGMTVDIGSIGVGMTVGSMSVGGLAGGVKQIAAGLIRHRASRQRRRFWVVVVVSGMESWNSHRPLGRCHSMDMHSGSEASIARCRAALWARQADLHWFIELILTRLDEKKRWAPSQLDPLLPSAACRQQPRPACARPPTSTVPGVYQPSLAGSHVGDEVGVDEVGIGVGIGVGEVVTVTTGGTGPGVATTPDPHPDEGHSPAAMQLGSTAGWKEHWPVVSGEQPPPEAIAKI